jgi:DNA invertase Pin-like site-specific DNA recombinase
MDLRVLDKLRKLRGRHDDETRALIRQCIEAGARTQDIADALGISRSTLWRHYGDELSNQQLGTPDQREEPD